MKPERLKRPSTLRNLWEWWKRFGKRIGDIQARVLLTLFYFVILGPFALAIRWWSDPLAIREGAPRGWRSKVEDEATPVKQATKQF